MTSVPLVTIVCLAYNHEPYIREALDGFLMQQTNFLFNILINDDASTDATAAIIREYEGAHPNIISPVYQTDNQYSKGVHPWFDILFPKVVSKYIALCEGDDYWTDPLKLQKQIDFLEANPQFGLCYSQCRQYNQSSDAFGPVVGGCEHNDFNSMLSWNPIPTLTVVARRELVDRYHKEVHPERQRWLMGDYPMWLWFAHESRIKFLPGVTGVYRVLEDSASHSKSVEKHLAFGLSSLNIREFYNDYFELGYSKEYFLRERWCTELRSYSIYLKWGRFLKIWSRGICRRPMRLFWLSSYKYFLFFFSPRLRQCRM